MRVRAACVLVAVLACVHLLLSMTAARELLDANAAVEDATAVMATQRRLDAQISELRTVIGDATRRVERGAPVSPATWSAINAELDKPARSGRPVWMALRAEESTTADQLKGAVTRFDRTARRLVAAARGKGAHDALMPEFLASLRAAEAASLEARARVAAHAEASAAANARSTRWWAGLAMSLAAAALLVTVACALWLQRRVTTPLRRLAATLERMNVDRGAIVVADAERADEVGALARGVLSFYRATAEREEALDMLRHLARHDPLTGLPNRRHMDEQLAHALAAAAADGGSVALLWLDLDGFKAVNDGFGHAVGDAVLRDTAAALREVCGKEALIGRMGGDEFAVVQAGRAQPGAARELAGRLLAAATRRADGAPAAVGLSVGVALYPQDATDEARLRHLADVALYRAKHDGRGCVRLAGARPPEAIGRPAAA